MPAFTTNQWAILFLVLVLGWILGLASRAGSGKWKRALAEERDARAESDRRQAEELAAARTRIAELERTVQRAPVAAPVATPARGGRDDDLGLIRGIGPVGAERLADQGVTRYRQIIALGATEKADLERRLGAPEGTIDSDDWQGQAALLDEGRIDEHRRRFAD